MSSDKAVPLAAPRVTEEQTLRICRLALRQVAQTEIARRVGVHRNTVRRVLKRTRGALAATQDTAQDRAEAIAVLREVQRTAWEDMLAARARGRSTAMLLAEVRLAQQQINALLGLQAPAGPDDPALQLQQFKAILVGLIQQEAPQLAPRLAQKLLEARGELDEA